MDRPTPPVKPAPAPAGVSGLMNWPGQGPLRGDQFTCGANLFRGQQAAQEHVPVGGQPRPERCRITGQATGIGQLIHPVTVTLPPENPARASWEASRYHQAGAEGAVGLRSVFAGIDP